MALNLKILYKLQILKSTQTIEQDRNTRLNDNFFSVFYSLGSVQ